MLGRDFEFIFQSYSYCPFSDYNKPTPSWLLNQKKKKKK